MFVRQHNRKPILLLFIYFSFLFSSYSAASDCPNQPITYAQVTDEQLLIISLRLNGIPILDDMSVYQVDEQLLLPVSILTDVLKLPIKFNKSTISGNLLAQQCEFNWLLLKKSNTAKKNPWRWGNDEFDDYIDAKLLSTMLGSEYEFSYSLQQLSLNTTLNLDILEQLKAANIRRTKRIIVPADLIINDQYNTINYPVISYNLNNNYQSANKSNRTNLQLNSFFDFLKQSVELRVNTTKSTTNQYLKITKKFTFNDENSTNNAVSYQFGDIQSQRDNLIHTANLGAGFNITNANPYYNNSFSTITIEEATLAGWRAELYRNGQFIGESSAGDDNRVVFNDVDTFRGLNLFSIKLFGPEGQQITRQKKILVGNKQLTQNNWNYQFEYIDRNARFIDHNIANPSNNGLSAKALLSYGLSDDITFTTGSHFIRENNNDNIYLSTSIDGNIYDQNFTIQAAKNLAQGEALFAGLSGDISSQTKYKINYNLLNNFTSAIYRSTSNQIKSQLNIKLNGYSTYVNWRATLRNQQHKSGLSQNFLDLSLNKNLMNSTFSSSILFNDQSSLNTSINRLFWSYYAQPWNFSTSVDWLPFDQGKIQGVNSEIRWPQYRKVYNQTRLQYNPSQKASYNISHNLTFRHKNFNFQLIGQIDNQGDWQLSAGISGTLGYNNTTNKFMFLQPQALNSGLIEAQVFFDENQNNVFDNNEQALADVEFTGNYRWRNLKTNQQGKVLLPSVINGQNLTIKTQTLPDPYLNPKYKKVKIFTHQGGINKTALAVVAVNDIEGSIYQIINDKTRSAIDQTVTLLDQQGQEVAQTQSESDGYFVFDKIPPGTYSLQISSANIDQRSLTIVNLPKQIIASTEGDSIILPDILLVDQQYLNKQVIGEQNTTTQLEQNNKDESYNGSTQPSNNKNNLLENELFVVQLGVYKYPDSVITAAKSLPADLLNVRIYYNKQRFRYYLVAGTYSKVKLQSPQTQNTLLQLTKIAQFNHHFSVRAQRYLGKKWTLKYQLSGLQQHLQDSHKIINNAQANSYFCQLASYQSLISIDPRKFAEKLLIAKRNIKNKDYYSFIAGPFIDKQHQHCSDNIYEGLTPEIPIIKLTAVLQDELEVLNY